MRDVPVAEREPQGAGDALADGPGRHHFGVLQERQLLVGRLALGRRQRHGKPRADGNGRRQPAARPAITQGVETRWCKAVRAGLLLQAKEPCDASQGPGRRRANGLAGRFDRRRGGFRCGAEREGSSFSGFDERVESRVSAQDRRLEGAARHAQGDDRLGLVAIEARPEDSGWKSVASLSPRSQRLEPSQVAPFSGASRSPRFTTAGPRRRARRDRTDRCRTPICNGRDSDTRRACRGKHRRRGRPAGRANGWDVAPLLASHTVPSWAAAYQ